MDDTQDSNLGIEDLLASKRQDILALAKEYGADNVRVFGSVARGEARPDSDVDLLITFPQDRSVFDMVGLWLDLKDLLGCEVSLIADTLDDQAFLQRILQDAVSLK